MRRGHWSLLVFSLVGWTILVSPLPAQEKKAADGVTKKLETKISLEKGIDPNTPLQDVLLFLADRYDLTIVVDSKAFQAVGIEKVEEMPIVLKPVKDVALGKVLQKALDQVGATYQVEKGKVAVRPKAKK